MTVRHPARAEAWLLSLPPTRRQTQWVAAVAACQVAAIGVFAPFANIALPHIDAFIPAFEGIIFVTDLVTSVLLFSQFAIYRLRALLVLACGYLFTALIIIPHALTFPGAFSPTGLLGAGHQTTASLYWFWHLLFGLALLGYGLMRDEKSEPGRARTPALTVVVRCLVFALALVCGLTVLTTAGNGLLPVFFAGKVGSTPATHVASALTTLVCVGALVMLWVRGRSVLDQWLMIVTLAAILEIAVTIIFSAERFSLGWYAGRLFSLLTSTIVLVVLLAETTWLYAKVARAKEDKIRRLVDANIMGVCIWNLEGVVVEANDAFLRMLQYDREDVVSGRLSWSDLTPAEWREQNERAVAELRSTGTFQPVEKEYFRKDGSRIPVLIGGALFEGSSNEGVAFVLDLTERKRAETAMRESEARFRDYAETASDWFWEIGPDYKLKRQIGNASGPRPLVVVGTAPWERALDVDTDAEKWRAIRATMDLREPFRDFAYRAIGRDGVPMHIKASGKPVFDANGEFLGYRGTGTDVTAIVRAQEEHERLQRLESEFAHKNRVSMMGELAASLSHEIAQPIASARNNARAAENFLDLQPPDLGEVREALACAVADVDRAGDIIDRIRDQIRKVPARKGNFDLNAAISEIVILARSAIIRNGVSVQTRLAGELSPVHADRVQLQQVLLNLILNAIEAMGSVEAGTRELSVSTEQDHTGVIVAVRDSGPGIDPAHLARVFDAFYTTKSSGTGMGLSICRSIISAHGGRLWAEASELGGVVFQFTLPGPSSERKSHFPSSGQT